MLTQNNFRMYVDYQRGLSLPFDVEDFIGVIPVSFPPAAMVYESKERDYQRSQFKDFKLENFD